MKWSDKPIISSLLQTDFYKFAMGYFIFLNFPDVFVKFGFTNRTHKIKLGTLIDIGELRENLNHARTLSFDNSALHYLRGTNEYGVRMFSEPYLEFLRNFRLPEYSLEVRNGQLFIETEALWKNSTYWEIPMMSIVKALYTKAFMKKRSAFEQRLVFAEGNRHLGEKINKLKKYPEITFSEFGTRRAFNPDWQDHIVEVLANEIPTSQFVGTSNVYLAMKYGLMPMGTNAHELPMVVGGLFSEGKDSFIYGQKLLLNLWWNTYGNGLSMFLPDTFGSDFALSIITNEQAENWKGIRQDSGDPFKMIEKYIDFYLKRGIDVSKKLILPSDGLNTDKVIQLHLENSSRPLNERPKLSYGIGTDFTDDLGAAAPISIVVKATYVNGIPLIKLSDNVDKALGDPEMVERIKGFVGYQNSFSEEPTC